jgi:ABC-type branched-subunit amino acid transport system ATPase component
MKTRPHETAAEGVLHYTIRQQDGTLVEMSVADNLSMRLFVAWVERYESGGGKHENPSP